MVNSFRRLWAVQIIAHSARAFSTPRNRNWLKPRACLICPNSGSTTCFRNRFCVSQPPSSTFLRIRRVNGPPLFPFAAVGHLPRTHAYHPFSRLHSSHSVLASLQ